MKIWIYLFVICLLPLFSCGQSIAIIIGGDSVINCNQNYPALIIKDVLNNPGDTNTLSFDLNNDNVPDMEFNVNASNIPMSTVTGSADLYSFNNSLELLCDTYYYAWPDTMAEGDTLSQHINSGVWTSRLQWPDYPFNLRYLVNGNGGLGGTGFWQYSNPHYLGFRFITDTDTLYGYFYLNVTVTAGSSQLSVTNVCYQGMYNFLSGIHDLNQSSVNFTLVPNPVITDFKITSMQKGYYNGKLLDQFGREVKSFSFKNEYEANIVKLPPGLYYLLIESESGDHSCRSLIKQ